jgi:translation initiation factor 2 beta subunit (eIF-2beta)/eIF-5
LTINGQSIPNVTNQFILKNYSSKIQIGSLTREPEKFGFDFYGILQNEKILNTDIRKVGVTIKKAYTTQQLLQNIDAFYRVYVREGNTEVQVQDWTKINRTPNEYYFIFDTRDKIPNEYYVDIKVNISGEVDTYKKQLTFQIVNKK